MKLPEAGTKTYTFFIIVASIAAVMIIAELVAP